jgi:hypothetical protein
LRCTRCAAGCSTCPSGFRWNRDLTAVRPSLSQLSTMSEQGEDEISPVARKTESLGADFSKTARVVLLAENFRSSPPGQRWAGVVQSPWKGTRYRHERGSQGISRDSETQSAKDHFVAVAKFQALQHRVDTALTLGCPCGDGVVDAQARVLNAQEAIWRCFP